MSGTDALSLGQALAAPVTFDVVRSFVGFGDDRLCAHAGRGKPLPTARG
jgi:hypothetical protein